MTLDKPSRICEKASSAMEQELRQAVLDAMARPEALAKVDAIYGQLQRAIDERRPICNTSGRCCRFEEYGHRLYVSTLELARFHSGYVEGRRDEAPIRLGAGVSLKVASNPWDGKGCPFQSGGLCGAHSERPFGCRIFFCDTSSAQWQRDVYEELHGQLRRLHDELSVPYFYVEWRKAIEALGWA